MPDQGQPGFGPADLAGAYAFALEQLTRTSAAIAHPLGFIMLEQVPDGHGGYRRIHIWHRERAPVPIPHSHSGHLRSTILIGQMRNHTWRVETSASSVTPITEVAKVGQENRAYRLIGRACCVADASTEFGPGEIYVVPAGDYHSNEGVTEMCVTFVERLASSGDLAQIATSPDAAAASERVPMNVGRAEMASIAKDLRKQALLLGIAGI